MSMASSLSLRIVQLGVPLLAALVGLVAGVSPVLGLGLAAGVAYGVLVLSDVAVGFALFVLVSFLESLSFFSGLSLAKVSGGVLVLSWMALRPRWQTRQLFRDYPVLVTAMLLLAAWATISAVWSALPSAALDGALRWSLNLALFPIAYGALRERPHVRWVFAMFVVGALLSAAIGLASGTAVGVTDETRLGGNGVNANELGQLLVAALALAGGLAACRDIGPPGRVLATLAALLCLIGILMTVSRGALIGLIAALLLAPLLVGRGRRAGAVILAALALAIGAGYVFAVASPADRDRITQSETTGSGRTDLWRVGIEMVKANPVQGVGAGNFANSTVRYLFTAGQITRSDFIVDKPLPAHNVYLQALAELGIVGLVLFLAVLAFGVRCTVQAASRFAANGDRSMEILARALLIGLVGLVVSDFFSTAIYSKQLWLALATGVALKTLAEEQAAAR